MNAIFHYLVPSFAALTLAAAVGCETNPTTASDAGTGGEATGIPAAGMATLSGSQAFTVGAATMELSPSGGCGGTNDAGLPTQLGILFSSAGLPTFCSDGGVPTSGPGNWLEIVVSTTEAAQGMPITQALTPGVYVVGDEGQNDPDPCMLPHGTNAYVQLLAPGVSDAVSISVSGTVTIDTVSASATTGTFSVLMGDAYGKTPDGGAPAPLSGAFNATSCP